MKLHSEFIWFLSISSSPLFGAAQNLCINENWIHWIERLGNALTSLIRQCYGQRIELRPLRIVLIILKGWAYPRNVSLENQIT